MSKEKEEDDLKWSEIISDDEANEALASSQGIETTVRDKSGCCSYISQYNEGFQEVKEDPLVYFNKSCNLLSEVLSKSEAECQINCIRNSYMTIYALKNYGLLSEKYYTHYVDLFFRHRHEVLFKSTMSLLQLDYTSSDIKFSSLFDIESERTPDYIGKNGNDVLIVEITVASNIQRAAQSKGSAEYGYTGKYDREIAELKDKGYSCSYVVLIFDSSDLNNQGYKSGIREICDLLKVEMDKFEMHRLEMLRKEFCHCAMTFYGMFGENISRLFNPEFEIKRDKSEDVKCFLDREIKDYTGNFRIISLNQALFDSVCRAWSRMHKILDNSIDFYGLNSMVPKFDYASSRFSFDLDKNGLMPNDWMIIMNNEDKATFCKHLKTCYKNAEMEVVRSDIEFFYYEPHLNQESNVLKIVSSDPIVYTHMDSTIYNNVSDQDIKFADFENHVSNWSSSYEDSRIEEKLQNLFQQFDDDVENIGFDETMNKFKSKMLAGKVLNIKMCESAIEDYSKAQDGFNPIQESTDIKVYHAKQPFIYPLRMVYPESYTDYKTRPSMILNALQDKRMGPYTDKVLSIVSRVEHEWGTKAREKSQKELKLESELRAIQGELIAAQKQQAKELNMKRLPKIKELKNGDHFSGLMSKKQAEMRKLYGGDSLTKKTISSIRLRTSGKSIFSEAFKEEMAHFKSKSERSTYKGVGNRLDYNEISKVYDSIKDDLLSPAPVTCPDELFDNKVSCNEVGLLKHLKEDYLDHYKDYYAWLKNTNIYHACAFITRYCHTLLYLSQTTLSSDYISVDNLGYSDCLLMVKGGKKIFPTKRSKLHRLFYPVSSNTCSLFFPPGLESSFRKIEHDGRIYMVTPWIMLHETLITDGLSYLYKLMGFALMTYDKSSTFYSSTDKCYFNLILAIHARRQTEVCLHNLRYILANCLSDLTDLDTMLPEFAGYNYDCFQFYVRESIKINFRDYFVGMERIKEFCKKGNIKEAFSECKITHLFNKHKIKTLDDFSMSIYSTYLMPKAPITQSLEQVSNLKEMLKTHKLHMDQSSDDISTRAGRNYINIKDSIYDYQERLWRSDFNFDPSYMIHLGKFAADYLKTKISSSDLEIEWSKELNMNWDSLANSSGLRGDGEDFFGRKGYFVVYDEILKEDDFQTFLEKVKKNEIDEKYLKKVNQTYRSSIRDKELNQIIFHVVDKVQRGGKREIFVMDKRTKIHQQVIEGFMATLCKKCPTEMISIPSNRRLHSVHTRVFETKHDGENEQYYWVLDCRKWAPRSMLEKFIFFLSGMRGFLPESFLQHCYNFFNLMLNKQVHTRPHIVDIMKKSKANSWVDWNWLLKDESKSSMYFSMSYSWMMGIFNYFSSFVHVANQLHASHMIHTTTMDRFQSFSTLSPIAHSDDSAAKQSIKDSSLMRRSVMIYELLLKAANHMLSQKKCNIGKIYFEFISILYLKGELLPLLPKFLGGFDFHPTDSGYCSDVLDSYSKVISLIQNGATFQQAYLSMKIQSLLIWRFYFGMGRQLNYDLPPQMFGAPDAHPLCVLLSGSDADTLRIVSGVKGIDKLNRLNYIYESLALNDEDEFTIYKPIKIMPDIRPNNIIKKHKSLLPEDIEMSWTLKNVNFSNSYISALQYLLKLQEPSFVASMQDDNLTRRISRSYYFREHNVVNTRLGKMSQSGLLKLITAAYNVDDDAFFETLRFEGATEVKKEIMDGIKSNSKNFEVLRLLHSELLGLMEYWKHMDYDQDNLMLNRKTTKPIHINLQKVIGGINTKFEPSILCSWIKEPQYRNFLPNTSGCLSAEVELKQLMEDFGVNINDTPVQTLYHILGRIKNKTFSNIYCYGNVPSGLREINTYQDVTLYLAHNSFEDKFINGLTLPLGRMVNVSSQQILPELKLEEVQITCAMLNIILAASNTLKDDALGDFLRLEIHPPLFLGVEMDLIKMKELPLKFRNYWDKRSALGMYFGGLLRLTEKIVNEEEIDGGILKNSFFHSFVKRQTLIQDKWVGVGHIYVGLGNERLSLILKGKSVDKIILPSNLVNLNKIQINYLNYVLHSAECMTISESMCPMNADRLDDDWFGIGHDGGYRIDKGRNLRHYMQSTIIEPGLRTQLSNYDSLNIKTLPRLKLEATHYNELTGKKRFVINLMTVDTEKSIFVARKMLADTKHNSLITDFWNSDKDSYLIDLISEGLEVDMYTNPREVFLHYEYSKIFEIMQTSERMEIAKVKGVKVRDKLFPAQEGGLLHMLINYQIRFDDFKFNWDRVITPELMAIKSSQPEAFITGMVDRIHDRFNALYTSDEKAQIVRELNKIMETFDQEGKEQKLMSMLSNWGYTGVAGAVEGVEKGENFESFKVFREYSRGFAFMSEFGNIFLVLIKSVIDTILDDPGLFVANYISISNNMIRLSLNNLKETLVSFIHTFTMSVYTEVTGMVSMCFTMCDIFFQECFTTFFLNDELLSKFRKELSGHYLLGSLECNYSSRIQFMISYRALLHCFRLSGCLNISVDPTVRKLQSTNFTLPIIKTKEIAETLGLKFNVRRANYHGLCSEEFLTRLHTSYNTSFGGTNYSIWFKPEKVIGKPRVKYNPKYFFDYMLTESFLESDEFDEIKVELTSASPDMDFIEEMVDTYRQENGDIFNKNEGVYHRITRGKRVKQVKVTVVNLLGHINLEPYMQHLRQLGNDILILANSIYCPLLFGRNNFMFFQFNDQNWYNHSINKHDHIWGIVLSNNIKQPQVWEQTLNARFFDRNFLANMVKQEGLLMSRSTAGVEYDAYSLTFEEDEQADQIWEGEISFDIGDVTKSNESETEEELVQGGEGGEADVDDYEAKVSDYRGKLLNMGFEEESISQFLKMFDEAHNNKNRSTESIFMDVIKSMFEKKSFIDSIKQMSEGLLKMPLTEEQVNRIFQVPYYFGKNISKNSTIKNNALKDKKLYAELESLTSGMCGKIISGTMTITPRMKERVHTNIRMCNRLIRGTRNNKRQKRFLIDFYTMLLNDAHVTTDSDTKDEWSEIMASMNEFVMLDEDDEDQEMDIYNVDTERGRLPYRLSGDSARLFRH